MTLIWQIIWVDFSVELGFRLRAFSGIARVYRDGQQRVL